MSIINIYLSISNSKCTAEINDISRVPAYDLYIVINSRSCYWKTLFEIYLKKTAISSYTIKHCSIFSELNQLCINLFSKDDQVKL